MVQIREELVLFLVSFFFGVRLKLGYELCSGLGRFLWRRRRAETVVDFLFTVVACVMYFFFLLEENKGEFRFFSVLGVGLGVFLWGTFISPYYLSFFSFVAEVFKKRIEKGKQMLYNKIDRIRKERTHGQKKKAEDFE